MEEQQIVWLIANIIFGLSFIATVWWKQGLLLVVKVMKMVDKIKKGGYGK